MSNNLSLSDLQRDGATSITQQLVDRFAEAIEGGALEPGAKLPTTRALAAEASINHLTAARVYRRLAELGYVTAAVGRGTFVRQRPPVASAPAGGEEDEDWQHGLLAPRPTSYADGLLLESLYTTRQDGAIPLAAGFPDPELCPSEELARLAGEIAHENPRSVTDYLHVEGLPELRERIADLGADHGFARGPDEIIVTSGARQGIDLVARALLTPDDVVAIESPTFGGLLTSVRGSGAHAIALPVDEHGIDVDALERLLARHEIKLVVLQPFCHNPTGVDLAPERARRLIELARERNFFVLEDGVYATSRLDGEEQRRRLRADAPGHVIYVDSLSKTIGGGMRIGWVAASGPVLGRLVRLKMDSDIHTAALPQQLAARYLSSGHHFRMLERSQPVYRRRRDSMLTALERHLGDEASWLEPAGGHHVWVTLRRPVDERALYAAAIAAGVTFLPGGAVVVEPGSHTSMRLSFGFVPAEQHDEALRRLAVAVREARRRQGVASIGPLS